MALFSRWRSGATAGNTRLEAGDMTVHVIPASNQITLAVAGRVTVDSSPNLRSALLDLLRRKRSSSHPDRPLRRVLSGYVRPRNSSGGIEGCSRTFGETAPRPG